jgi:hypothetical protein
VAGQLLGNLPNYFFRRKNDAWVNRRDIQNGLAQQNPQALGPLIHQGWL